MRIWIYFQNLPHTMATILLTEQTGINLTGGSEGSLYGVHYNTDGNLDSLLTRSILLTEQIILLQKS